MEVFTDWSLLSNFLIKGVVSCFLITLIGVALTRIKPYYDPEDDKE